MIAINVINIELAGVPCEPTPFTTITFATSVPVT